MPDDPKYLVRTRDLPADGGTHIRHPLNPNSDVRIQPLSTRPGMERMHLNLARVPPGRDSFIPHAHSVQEEFLFILSGFGTAMIGDETYDVGPGDYMGFPIDGTVHHLTNTGSEDLVYLMGGERTPTEVSAFSSVGKVLVHAGGRIRIFDTDDAKEYAPTDWMVDDDAPPPGG